MKQSYGRKSISGMVMPLILGIILMIAGSQVGIADQEDPAFLGVTILSIDHMDKKELGTSHGVRVAGVSKGSPAEKAGIREQDVILRLDDLEILTPEDLISSVKARKPGDRVTVTILRDGKEKQLKIQLSSWRNMDGKKSFGKWGKGKVISGSRPWLGVQLLELNDDLAAYFKVKPRDGVLVLEVEKDSPADKGGIRAGDVIHQLDGERVVRPLDARRIVRQLKCDQEVPIRVIRHGKSAIIRVTIGKKEWMEDLKFHFFPKGSEGKGVEFLNPPGKHRGLIRVEPDEENEKKIDILAKKKKSADI